MSLVQLLTAGKSFIGLRDGASPYRVTHQRLLPKFGSDKNPFRPTIPTDGEPSPLNESAKSEAWLNRFSRNLKQRFTRKRAKTVPQETVPSAKPPEQAELSLERVKVIRNDLRDADLEVVQAKGPFALMKPATSAQPAAPTAPASVAPGRAGARQVAMRLVARFVRSRPVAVLAGGEPAALARK